MAKVTFKQEYDWRRNFNKVLKSIPKLVKRFGWKRTQPQMEVALDKAWNKLLDNIVVQVDEDFKKEMKGQGTPFGQVDEDALRVVKQDHLRSLALTKLKTKVKETMVALIKLAIQENWTMRKLSKSLQGELQISKSSAERIIRNELHEIKNKARDQAYDKIERRRDKPQSYRWIGPNDHRTTKICKNIVRRTSKGVSRPELKQIIKEEADKNMYSSLRPFTPHYSCRHIQNRIV